MMRTLALGVLLMPGLALAQPFPVEVLFAQIGAPWQDTAQMLPAPASGRVADGAGTLVWTDVGEDDVERVTATVRRDTLRSVSFTGADTPALRRRFTDMWNNLKREFGAPDALPFFTAEQMGEENPMAIWVDVSVDVPNRTMTLRQPATPSPWRSGDGED
jgi:hypothetical protein